MEGFTELLPDEIHEKLLSALNQKNPFRSFKDALEGDDELKKDWYSHYNGLVWFRAMEWLHENAAEKV
mgnify:CR=1 FL=1